MQFVNDSQNCLKKQGKQLIFIRSRELSVFIFLPELLQNFGDDGKISLLELRYQLNFPVSRIIKALVDGRKDWY